MDPPTSRALLLKAPPHDIALVPNLNGVVLTLPASTRHRSCSIALLPGMALVVAVEGMLSLRSAFGYGSLLEMGWRSGVSGPRS